MPVPTQLRKATTEVKTEHIISTRTPDWIDSITLLTPILTFLLGYFLNKLVEDYKENQRLNQIEKYYFSLLRSLVNSIHLQADSIAHTVKALQVLKSNDLLIARVTSLQTSRISNVSDIDLYKAFIARSKRVDERNTNLSNIAAAIDFVNDAAERIRRINDDFVSKHVVFQQNWAKMSQEMLDTKNGLVIEAKANKRPPSPDAKHMIKIFYQHLQANTKEVDNNVGFIINTYKNLIIPLHDDIKDFVPTEKTYKLFMLISSAKIEFDQFFNFRNRHANQIAMLEKSLKESAISIMLAVNELKRKK